LRGIYDRQSFVCSVVDFDERSFALAINSFVFYLFG